MKALFSFIAILFFLWVGVVYILPQTRLAEQLHQKLEERLSKELQADVSIRAIDFSLLPRPRLELEGVAVKKNGVLLTSLHQASVLLNLSALLSQRIAWLEVSLDRPILYDEGKEKTERLAQFFYRFHHIKINGGEVRKGAHQWQNISGQVSAGKNRPISGKVRFLFREEAYQLKLSLGRLDGAAPIALEGKLVAADGKALSLSGFLQGAGKQFTGRMEWKQSDAQVRGTIDAVRKGDFYQVQLSDGEGVYRKKILSSLSAKIHLGLELLKIKDISASALAGKAHLSQGVLEIGTGETGVRFSLHAKNFTALLKELASGFIVPPHLGQAHLRVEFSTKGERIQKLKAEGKIDKSQVLIKVKENQLFTRWQASDSAALAHQFGVPRFLAARQPGKLWLKMTKKKGWSPFAVKARWAENLYLMKGKLHWGKKALQSKVKVRTTFARGTGNLDAGRGALKIGLNLEKLVLSDVRQAAVLRWIGAQQGSFDIKADSVLLGKHRLSSFSTQGYFKDRNVRLRKARGNFAAGSFDGAADVVWQKVAGKGSELPHYTLALKLKNMESKILASLLTLPSFIEGKTGLTIRLSTFGTHKSQWLGNLNGQGEIVLSQGKLIGFDAALLNQSLPQLELFSLLEVVIDYAFNHGDTSLEYGRSKFSIQQGKLTASRLHFDREDIKGGVQFSADLSAGKMAADFYFKMPLRPQYPALGWRVVGNWHAPEQKFDSIGFEKALARDIITGGIKEIKNEKAIYILPLALQDLLYEARKKKTIAPLDLELQMDLTSQAAPQ